MTTTPIVTTLNRAWEAIQRNHPEVPHVMIVTGRRRHKSEHATRGSHCADQWHVDGRDGRHAEVWISGERLGEGAEAVMQTLLHEAAHALSNARGVKDTSDRGRYHNKAFARTAAELGLEPPKESGGPKLGYSDCQITKKTTEVYDYEVKQLAEACKNFVAPAAPEPPKVRTPPLKAHCDCPDPDNEITWTKKLQAKFEFLGIFPLVCAVCRQPFVPEDEPEAPTERDGVKLLRLLTGEGN